MVDIRSGEYGLDALQHVEPGLVRENALNLYPETEGSIVNFWDQLKFRKTAM